jgi:SAM-dependent methyltransferase
MFTAVVRLIEWTGERAVPWVQDPAMLYEHFHRYLWAARLLDARRVLDLGSGEGYGAAILASRSTEVLGVDIDEQAVEHANANYARPGLRFERASALDLSGLADGSFDAVVAFEMIEHVADHGRVMDEIGRVLAPDGMLVISTPDKDRYSRASGQVNAFHERELTFDEFVELLGSRYEHVAIWGQRTINGSYLSAIGPVQESSSPAGADFFVSAGEDGLEVVEEPEPLFYVAVASRGALPAVARSSTLADFGLELVQQTARAHAVAVAERDRLLGEVNSQLFEANRTLDEKREEVLAVAAKLASVEQELLAKGAKLLAVEHELADAQTFIRRVEESVTWQSFQRAKAALYGVIGQESRLGRALGAMLRLLGRTFMRGSRRPPG